MWNMVDEKFREKETRCSSRFTSNQQKLERGIAHVESQLNTKVNRTETRSMIDEKFREKDSRHQNSIDTRLQENWRQINNDLATLKTKIANLEIRLYRYEECYKQKTQKIAPDN